MPRKYDAIKCIEYMIYKSQLIDKDLFQVFAQYDKKLNFTLDYDRLIDVFRELKVEWFLPKHKLQFFEEFQIRSTENENLKLMSYLSIMHSVYQPHQLVIRIFQYVCNQVGSNFKKVFREMQRLNNNYSEFWSYEELSTQSKYT